MGDDVRSGVAHNSSNEADSTLWRRRPGGMGRGRERRRGLEGERRQRGPEGGGGGVRYREVAASTGGSQVANCRPLHRTVIAKAAPNRSCTRELTACLATNEKGNGCLED